MSFQHTISNLKKKAKARLLCCRPEPDPEPEPEPETTEAGSGRVELTKRLQPTPNVGVVEGGGNFNSSIGGSDGMYTCQVHVTLSSDHICRPR